MSQAARDPGTCNLRNGRNDVTHRERRPQKSAENAELGQTPLLFMELPLSLGVRTRYPYQVNAILMQCHIVTRQHVLAGFLPN